MKREKVTVSTVEKTMELYCLEARSAKVLRQSTQLCLSYRKNSLELSFLTAKNKAHKIILKRKSRILFCRHPREQREEPAMHGFCFCFIHWTEQDAAHVSAGFLRKSQVSVSSQD